MGRRAATGGLIAALAVIGCGADPPPEPRPTADPTAAPSGYPVAYRVAERTARRLGDSDALELLDREGRVVARTEWESLPALAMVDWLDRRGLDLDAHEYQAVLGQLADEQELSALIVTQEPADGLRRFRPSRRELARYYERFTGDGLAQAGEAMLDWLRVFRVASQSADDAHVVVIPLFE